MFSLITSLIIAFADDLTLPICFAFSVQLAARFLPPPVILQLFSCTKPTAVIWGSSHTIINASPHIFFSFPASDNVTLTALQWNPPKCSCSVLQLWTQIDIYTPTSTHDKRHETLPGGEAVNGVLKVMKLCWCYCMSAAVRQRNTWPWRLLIIYQPAEQCWICRLINSSCSKTCSTWCRWNLGCKNLLQILASPCSKKNSFPLLSYSVEQSCDICRALNSLSLL